MSDPHDLPARVRLSQPEEIKPCRCSLEWTGGGAGHAVCAVDADGKIVMRLDVSHDAEGLRDLLGKLRQIGCPADLPIAIERPLGPRRRNARRCRPPNHPDPSQRRSRLPPALSRRWWQKRSRRCLHAGGHPAHRRTSLPPAHGDVHRGEGIAHVGAWPRRLGEPTRRV